MTYDSSDRIVRGKFKYSPNVTAFLPLAENVLKKIVYAINYLAS